MTFSEHFSYMWWAYVVIFVMICLSAYFSASEIAFNSANKMRLRRAAEGGSKTAAIAHRIAEKFTVSLSAILIGNNLANVSYSAATAALSVYLFSQNEIASVLWSFFAAFVVLYTSEFMPKLLCSARPLRRILLLSGPFRLVSLVLSPVTFIAIKFTDFFVPPKKNKERLTAGDLMRILEDRKDGVCISDVESALIGRIVVLRAKGKKITPDALLDALRD